jgi:uncharacterized protein YpmS
MNRWKWIVVALLALAVIVVGVRYLMPAPVKVAGSAPLAALPLGSPATA